MPHASVSMAKAEVLSHGARLTQRLHACDDVVKHADELLARATTTGEMRVLVTRMKDFYAEQVSTIRYQRGPARKKRKKLAAAKAKAELEKLKGELAEIKSEKTDVKGEPTDEDDGIMAQPVPTDGSDVIDEATVAKDLKVLEQLLKDPRFAKIEPPEDQSPQHRASSSGATARHPDFAAFIKFQPAKDEEI